MSNLPYSLSQLGWSEIIKNYTVQKDCCTSDWSWKPLIQQFTEKGENTHMDNVDCEFIWVFKKEEGNVSLGTGNLHKKDKQELEGTSLICK